MIKIIEMTTGIEVARAKTIAQAIQLANRRKCKWENMKYVVGAPDVQMHEFAATWASMYNWLGNKLIKYNSEKSFIDKASSRLALWKLVKDSREVTSEEGIAPHLGAVIGYELHEDIELLIRFKLMQNCHVTGPETEARKREAGVRGARLSAIYSPHNDLVFAIHEELGAIVIAPAAVLAGRNNFKIHFHFGR